MEWPHTLIVADEGLLEGNLVLELVHDASLVLALEHGSRQDEDVVEEEVLPLHLLARAKVHQQALLHELATGLHQLQRLQMYVAMPC
jgi:hypothetical protein